MAPVRLRLSLGRFIMEDDLSIDFRGLRFTDLGLWGDTMRTRPSNRKVQSVFSDEFRSETSKRDSMRTRNSKGAASEALQCGDAHGLSGR